MSNTTESLASNAASSLAIHDPTEVAAQRAASIQVKYNEERDKRLRTDGTSQYIDLALSERFRHFQNDPWVDHETLNAQKPLIEDGHKYKFLIQGAGFGGILSAVRLVQAGISANDIRIVDSAGGFGGTWYWNRYPGLQCDVESYIYMPLLEETGYMPTYKYAQGPEIREYANELARKWNLDDKAAFRMQVLSMIWDDVDKEWSVHMREDRGCDQNPRECKVKAQFVITASGVLNYPQIPDIPGIGDFEQHIFHTSRWDYRYTGGSPTDPTLSGLEGKTVGIIGTGATAVQAVPHLAKYAGRLFVFQRTPSAVDRRDNAKTDPELWATAIQTKKGWQRERMENFNAFVSNQSPLPPVNLVNDGWANATTYSALTGSANGIVTPEMVPAHLTTLHATDLVRQERIRARVDDIVKDKDTADKLKAWYPTWCKRPTFHDEYLPAFNKPNVTLIDTNGKGVDKITKTGVVVVGGGGNNDAKEHNLDVLILGTGYRSPSKNKSPAARANISVIGRDGRSLEETWDQDGVATLHGCISHSFPNLFFPGPAQAGVSANFTFVLEQITLHISYIISESYKKQASKESRVVVEPTLRAQEEWSLQIVSRAAAFAGLSGCTPGYLTGEGEVELGMGNVEERVRAARDAIWGEGVAGYVGVLEGWRARGGMEGIEVEVFSRD